MKKENKLDLSIITSSFVSNLVLPTHGLMNEVIYKSYETQEQRNNGDNGSGIDDEIVEDHKTHKVVEGTSMEQRDEVNHKDVDVLDEIPDYWTALSRGMGFDPTSYR